MSDGMTVGGRPIDPLQSQISAGADVSSQSSQATDRSTVDATASATPGGAHAIQVDETRVFLADATGHRGVHYQIKNDDREPPVDTNSLVIMMNDDGTAKRSIADTPPPFIDNNGVVHLTEVISYYDPTNKIEVVIRQPVYQQMHPMSTPKKKFSFGGMLKFSPIKSDYSCKSLSTEEKDSFITQAKNHTLGTVMPRLQHELLKRLKQSTPEDSLSTKTISTWKLGGGNILEAKGADETVLARIDATGRNYIRQADTSQSTENQESRESQSSQSSQNSQSTETTRTSDSLPQEQRGHIDSANEQLNSAREAAANFVKDEGDDAENKLNTALTNLGQAINELGEASDDEPTQITERRAELTEQKQQLETLRAAKENIGQVNIYGKASAEAELDNQQNHASSSSASSPQVIYYDDQAASYAVASTFGGTTLHHPISFNANTAVWSLSSAISTPKDPSRIDTEFESESCLAANAEGVAENIKAALKKQSELRGTAGVLERNLEGVLNDYSSRWTDTRLSLLAEQNKALFEVAKRDSTIEGREQMLQDCGKRKAFFDAANWLRKNREAQSDIQIVDTDQVDTNGSIRIGDTGIQDEQLQMGWDDGNNQLVFAFKPENNVTVHGRIEQRVTPGSGAAPAITRFVAITDSPHREIKGQTPELLRQKLLEETRTS